MRKLINKLCRTSIIVYMKTHPQELKPKETTTEDDTNPVVLTKSKRIRVCVDCFEDINPGSATLLKCLCYIHLSCFEKSYKSDIGAHC